MIDCHTHLQPHGSKPPMTRALIDEYVRVGADRGITQICITEHLFRFREAYDMLYGWWDADPDTGLAGMAAQYWEDHVSGSIADYVRLIEDAKRDGVPVLLGLEMDWIRGREETLRTFLAPYDWDIVLGSVHYVDAWGIDDDAFVFEWEKRDIAQVWGEYGELMRELAESGLVDALTHPDVLKKFGHRPQDETPLHDAILAGASVHGTAIELNSNGLRRCGEIFPALPLVERARALGLPITLASDAHTPGRVGSGFEELTAWARAGGYTEATSFVARKPVAHALSA
ncbi:MAG: PHP domain-containing protein [Chloroflexota bacterium]|nr:PHP domain-containing protein [Chloroflexota bacterium]